MVYTLQNASKHYKMKFTYIYRHIYKTYSLLKNKILEQFM